MSRAPVDNEACELVELMEIFSLENFLWLQAALAIFGVYYLFRRNRNGGFRLRMRRSEPRSMPAEMSQAARFWQPANVRTSAAVETSAAERALNVHFNYNGHSWDAYETLGLPAGASLEKVEAAFRQAVEQSDPSSRDFYHHAVQAIRKHRV